VEKQNPQNLHGTYIKLYLWMKIDFTLVKYGSYKSKTQGSKSYIERIDMYIYIVTCI